MNAAMQLIEKHFLDLLRKKPFNAITVSEVCSLSGVSRKTFYTYYRNLNSLMRKSVRRGIVDIIESHDMKHEYREALREVFNWAECNEDILSNIRINTDYGTLTEMMRGNSKKLVNELYEYYCEKTGREVNPLYEGYVSDMCAEVYAGIVCNWSSLSSNVTVETAINYIVSSFLGLVNSQDFLAEMSPAEQPATDIFNLSTETLTVE